MLKRARGLVSALQPFPQQIHLAGAGPRGSGLARSDFDKGPAHRGEELRITRSLKYLDQKRAVRFQMAPREFQRQFTQMDAAGLVGRAHPAQIGGHVRHYKVEPSPLQGGLDPFEHFLVAEISADDSNPGYRRNFQKIDRDDASGPPDALRDRLRPSPRRSPEIDHGVPGMRELVPLRDFDQLVRRARAVTVRLCAVNVGIADVAPEPSLAGFAAGHSLDFLNARIITRPPMRRSIMAPMQVITGIVVDGKVVVEGLSLPEGSVVTVFARDEESPVKLPPAEEAELLDALDEADREEGISAEELFDRLRKHG